MKAAWLVLALCLVGPARAELPWSDPRVPWRVEPARVREGAFTASLAGERLRSDFSGVVRERTIPPAGDRPCLRSGHALLDALHRMALAEARDDVRPDGALMAGAMWPGVWTRDVSYATHLAFATVAPAAAAASLRAKVFGDRVRQDTGTGGAWPVSTDRVVWTLAAWEVWLATGDRAWLAWAHRRAERTALEDRAVAQDPRTGLMFGESSFMDWREQTYPRWMQPVDIYETRALGTNVLHAASWRVLARMQRALGRPGSAEWDARAAALERAIVRHFARREPGPLAALVYPDPDGQVSGQSEALGNALAILTGVLRGDAARAVLDGYPLSPYGVPTIHPQLPGIPPYHNRSVWPFVQAYWALAGARAGRPEVFQHGLGAMMRAGALMLSFKENMVADTGRPEGTAINSDRQLWSVAGFLALVQRGLFGLDLAEGGLCFAPTVPAGLADPIRLERVVVRGALLDLEVHGHGGHLEELTVDGVRRDPAQVLPYPGAGRHRVVMRVRDLAESHPPYLLAGPLPAAAPRPLAAARGPAVAVPYNALSRTVEVDLPVAGRYAVRALYANGAGPINTDSSCALRALEVDGRRAGVLVMPQRGLWRWDDFGRSSAVRLSLGAGAHAVALVRDPLAQNMAGGAGELLLKNLTFELEAPGPD